MLFHARLNTVSAGLIFPLFSGVTLTALWCNYSFVWLSGGVGLSALQQLIQDRWQERAGWFVVQPFAH